MKHSVTLGLLMLLTALSFLAACGETTREEYRAMAAEEVCNEAQRCDNLGSSSYDDCIIENTARFNDMWPASSCDDGRINEDRYTTCINRARIVACSGNIFDYGAAMTECSASRVCID